MGRLAAELEVAHARFALLARHVPGGAVFLFDTEGRYVRVEGESGRLTNGTDPVGLTPADLYPPGLAEYVQDLYDTALGGLERTFRRDSPNGRIYDITVAPVRAGGRVVGGMSLLIDVTDRAHTEQEQEALRRISDAVFEGRSPDAVFGLVVEQVVEIFGAVGAAVFRYEDDGDAVALAAAPAGVLEYLPDPRVATAGTAVGRVAETGRPLFVAQYPEGGPHDPLVAALRTLGAVGGVAAPISIRQRLWGALGFGSADPARLTEETALRLARFADLAATTLGNVETWHALAHDASTDLLTGLPNRRTFVEHLGQEIARARRSGHPLALVLFDIDHFKAVNDTHGHLVGDRVLAALARVVGGHARGEEMIARIGGEEFAMILPETDTPGATAAAERLRLAVAAARPADVHVTISAGIDGMRHGDEPDDLVFRADQALYRAKADGRNLTRCWVPGGDGAASGTGPRG